MVRCSAITGAVCAMHDHAGHPECNARLITACAGIPRPVTVHEPEPAPLESIMEVHDPYYIEWLRSRCAVTRAVGYLDPDTYITPRSFLAATYAAGAALSAAERAYKGEHCFSMMRPPGHHAEHDRAMGFCLLNNAAIAANGALDWVDRVAIVDWDVHHGNGTQHCFYGTDRVLYCSVHQAPAFPFSGGADETGKGKGLGFTVNAPLSAGSTAADYVLVFSDIFAPVLERFRPDLLIVSAGQDILYDDPLGMMNVEPPAFAWLTRILADAVESPLALVLEGGYSPSHGEAISSIFHALAGDATTAVPDGIRAREDTLDLVNALKNIHRLI